MARWSNGARWPLLPLRSPGPQRDFLPLVIPWHHPFSILSRPSDHWELALGFQSGRKCSLGNERSTVLSRRFISPNLVPLFQTLKTICHYVFYLILSLALWKRMFLLTLERGGISSFHSSFHPFIHPSLHVFIKYPCVTGVGGLWWHRVCPHRVDCPVRKTHIKKLHFSLQILVITRGVYCKPPGLQPLFSTEHMLQDAPMGALGFWQSGDGFWVVHTSLHSSGHSAPFHKLLQQTVESW